ncbi:MAG: hypothetical protein RMK52_08300 [Chitinophagales bacterium]|nr:hypothetical protein [Chitinophagales bacterium]MDW8394228.1 hypothetical protein [Chitinophagales bacterium]
MVRSLAILILIATGILRAGAQCLSNCGCDLLPHRALNQEQSTSVQIFFQGNFYNAFSEEEMLEFAGAEPVYSVASQQAIQLSVKRLVGSKGVILATMPYLFSTDNREAFVHGNQQVHLSNYGNLSGFGDASVLAGIRYRQSEEAAFQMTLLGGLKMPTGQRNAFGSTGLLPPVHLQAGSGSWDPLLQIWAEYTSGPYRFQGRLAARLATEADYHNMGNNASAGLSAQRHFSVMLSGQAFYVTAGSGLQAVAQQPMSMPAYHHGRGPDESLVRFANSGYFRLLLLSEAGLAIRPDVMLPIRVLIPIYQYNQGHQVPLNWQLQTGIEFKF